MGLYGWVYPVGISSRYYSVLIIIRHRPASTFQFTTSSWCIRTLRSRLISSQSSHLSSCRTSWPGWCSFVESGMPSLQLQVCGTCQLPPFRKKSPGEKFGLGSFFVEKCVQDNDTKLSKICTILHNKMSQNKKNFTQGGEKGGQIRRGVVLVSSSSVYFDLWNHVGLSGEDTPKLLYQAKNSWIQNPPNLALCRTQLLSCY